MRLGCEDIWPRAPLITGGATQLPGMAELAEEVLGIPVRLGMPRGLAAWPMWSSRLRFHGVGLFSTAPANRACRTPQHPSPQWRRNLQPPAPGPVERVLVSTLGR